MASNNTVLYCLAEIAGGYSPEFLQGSINLWQGKCFLWRHWHTKVISGQENR